MSEHFEVGTWVQWRAIEWGKSVNRRAEVVARPGGGFMLVRYEDQTTEILMPQALAYESKV